MQLIVERWSATRLALAALPLLLSLLVPREAIAEEVHVASETRVTLSRHTPSRGWVEACTAPCDAWLPPGPYRVGGGGLAGPAEFDLREETSLVVVEQRSKSGRLAGGLMLAGSVAGAVAGGVLIAVGLGWGGQDCGAVTPSLRGRCSDLASDGAALHTAGFVSLGAAVVLGLAGLYVLLNAGHATVTQAAGIAR